MDDSSSPRRIKSLERTHDIVERLRRTHGAKLSEIADDVGATPSTIHTYLATLREAGYVVKDGDQYRLGPEFVTLGEYVRSHSQLYQAAREEVDGLAAKTGEAVHLVIEHQGRGITLYERFGEEAIGTEFHETLRQQPHQHLHCTASGKAMLAHLPEDRTAAILDEQGLEAQTEHSITDRERLREEFAPIRERGYAINDEEELLGTAAVATPIRDRRGAVLGSLAISIPKTRIDQESFQEDVVQLLERSTNAVEVNLRTTESV